MHFIIFDLEFNQDFSSEPHFDRKRTYNPFEIIQIGAIKLDLQFNTIATFSRYVKPTIYKKINPFISQLTGITMDQLLKEESFPQVYKTYTEFIDEKDAVFCSWGMSDIKELFRNADTHQLDTKQLPKLFINLQPYVSKHLSLPPKNLLRLQHAVEVFNIPVTVTFHNALHDAYYTAEVFKKIYNSSIQPQIYDPSIITVRPRQRKREIDIDKLLQQFEKMYARKITSVEQDMIKLAYKMGRTNQFLK